MSKSPPNFAISLISHTNVGKTTLARTLLRRDVGEIDDRAHVTDLSSAFEMATASDGAKLLLWDTPGFGDSVRLLKRLKKLDDPVGWFLSAVWDRISDRPFWCSQQAVLNIRDEADIVLYLVNATEDPGSAGFVEPELEVIEWLGKPVMVLVNQTGPAGNQGIDEGVTKWRELFERYPFVHDCLPFDAFARCWVQEHQLFHRIIEIAPQNKRQLVERLIEVLKQNNRRVFSDSMESLARQLAIAAADEAHVENVGIAERLREFVSRAGLKLSEKSLSLRETAMADLATRLDEGIRLSMGELISLHGLAGDADAIIFERMRESYSTREPVHEGIAAVLGGFVSGALGGLAADIAAGGMTFGGGAVAGGIIGAAGAGGLAKGYNLIRGQLCAIGKPHRAHRAALGVDPLHMGVVVKRRPQVYGQIGNRAGQRMHAALDAPDTTSLGLPDQRQDGGRLVGRSAHIGGIAPEKLREPWVAELPGECLRQSRKRRHVGHQLRAAQHLAGEPKGTAGPEPFAAPESLDDIFRQ